MTFDQFCQAHGVLVFGPVPIGKWLRFKTLDKPKSKNGSVKFMGDHGFVQNHATMQEVAMWRSEEDSPIHAQKVQQVVREAEEAQRRRQVTAAQEARDLIGSCRTTVGTEYMRRKGLADEAVLAYRDGDDQVIVIPMRVGPDVVGAQRIWGDGKKRFIYGQRSSDAVFSFGNGPLNVLCEGYATGVSVRMALSAARRPARVIVCFSAGNMKKVAESLRPGIVVADNDSSQTGQKVAQEIGWPFWISDREGEDGNDYHQRCGLFKFSQGLAMCGIRRRVGGAIAN